MGGEPCLIMLQIRSEGRRSGTGDEKGDDKIVDGKCEGQKTTGGQARASIGRSTFSLWSANRPFKS